jgi:hypothetical protein
MNPFRRALGPIAAAWLLCQTATLVFATVAFAVTGDATALLECTCAHDSDHTTCPMHHPAKPSKPGLCQIQCAGDAELNVLASLLGHVGLTPAMSRVLPSSPPRPIVIVDVSTHALRPEPPDPPPPRV